MIITLEQTKQKKLHIDKLNELSDIETTEFLALKIMSLHENFIDPIVQSYSLSFLDHFHARYHVPKNCTNYSHYRYFMCIVSVALVTKFYIVIDDCHFLLLSLINWCCLLHRRRWYSIQFEGGQIELFHYYRICCHLLLSFVIDINYTILLLLCAVTYLEGTRATVFARHCSAWMFDNFTTNTG